MRHYRAADSINRSFSLILARCCWRREFQRPDQSFFFVSPVEQPWLGWRTSGVFRHGNYGVLTGKNHRNMWENMGHPQQAMVILMVKISNPSPGIVRQAMFDCHRATMNAAYGNLNLCQL